MNVSASIVIFNCKYDDLIVAIDSFFLANGESLALIDNKSTTDIMTKLKKKYESNNNVFFLLLDKNYGFGYAHNRGFDELKKINKLGDYHIILNPDVKIDKMCISILSKYMNENQDVGLVSPKILNLDGSLQPLNKEFPNVFDMFVRRFFPKFIQDISFIRKRYDRYIRINIGYENISEVPFSSGCFMFFRSLIYENLNGFDEKIFLYMEDADICKRIWKFSKIIYNPNGIIYHKWNRDSKKKLKATMLFIRSVIYYFNKNGWKFF